MAATLTANTQLHPQQLHGRRGGLGAIGFALAVLALALLLLSGVSGAIGADPLTSSEEPGAPAARYVVQPGDTVWSIATELADGGDVRPVVDAIVDVRGTAPLQPGETILLP